MIPSYTHYENLDFFPKIPPVLKLDVRKVLWLFLPKYGELTFYKLIMTEVSKYLKKNVFAIRGPVTGDVSDS